MGNADLEMVKQIYRHSFGEELSSNDEFLLNEINLPTCEVVSHLKYGSKKEAFIQQLLNS